MFPLEEKEETKCIRVNLTDLSAQGIERFCDVFHGRYSPEFVNTYYLIRIRDVTYDEFAQIMLMYCNFSKSQKIHVVKHPVPHVDYHVNGGA